MTWLAAGRQHAEWERTSWLMAWTGRFGGGPFEPDNLNPMLLAGRPPPPPPTKRESTLGWAALGSALRLLSGKQKG